MKSGLKIGSSASITKTVTKDMLAQFDGELVHPVYSTVAMVYHMELVSRKLLKPFLEEKEASMGAEVRVKHIAPSGVGAKIHITATVSEKSSRQLVTEVLVKNENELIGKGEVKQAILPQETLEAKIKRDTSKQ